MVLLYQDPKREQVGTSTLGIPSATNHNGSDIVKTNMELKNKLASMEKLITELKNENRAIKVSNSNGCN